MDDEAEGISEEDISAWAAKLTPDGDPGAMAQHMRKFLGDRGYEKVVAQNDAAAALYLQRQTNINNLLSVAVGFGVLYGLAGLVAAVTAVAHMIF